MRGRSGTDADLNDRVLRDLCVASRDRLHRSGGLVLLFVFHPPQSGDRSHADPEAAAFTAGYPSRDSPFGYGAAAILGLLFDRLSRGQERCDGTLFRIRGAPVVVGGGGVRRVSGSA